MSVVFSFGSWVFMPDEDDMYVPAKVEEAFESGKPGKVNRDGHSVALSAAETKECIRMDEQSLLSVPNLVRAFLFYDLRTDLCIKSSDIIYDLRPLQTIFGYIVRSSPI
jgi:hypothetical protein